MDSTCQLSVPALPRQRDFALCGSRLFPCVFGIAEAVVDDVGAGRDFGFVGDDEIEFRAVFDYGAVAYADVIPQDDFARVARA